MKTIGILYICTDKYKTFWKEFYNNCEKYFLVENGYKKHYYVFTNANNIEFENEKHVHKIYQEPLSWPYITLYRFKIFNRTSDLLKRMDYLYFFNANMLVIDYVSQGFLPNDNQIFSFLQHPGFYNKSNLEFTYDRNPKSLAYISIGKGSYYFQGALNGGLSKDYLSMSRELEKNIDIDLNNNIVALWHDESHLNRYAIDHQDKIKILDPSYGYPEGWELPFNPKIIIRDKNKYGGHDFLRDTESIVQKIYRKFIK